MKTRRNKAFTLIELLVVIGIIVVLASLLLPAVMKAISTAEKTQARAEVRAIELALKAYLTDYNTFPSVVNKEVEVTLTKVLRGITTNTGNFRAVCYLDVSEKSIGTNAVPGGVDGQLYDPWGHTYKVAVDTNSVNSVSADGETVAGRSVAVWSWGPSSTSDSSTDTTHIRSWR
ncbi:MAG: type II secretion system protein [Kiritimatiellaeota bacterium]|nr:type II secretion system protein [Kiritimatiellota bacterium]